MIRTNSALGLSNLRAYFRQFDFTKSICNKKVLLRERKRHTNRGVSSTTQWGTPQPGLTGGVPEVGYTLGYPPGQVWLVGYPPLGYPPGQVWWGVPRTPWPGLIGVPEVGYPLPGYTPPYWGPPPTRVPPPLGYPHPPSQVPPTGPGSGTPPPPAGPGSGTPLPPGWTWLGYPPPPLGVDILKTLPSLVLRTRSVTNCLENLLPMFANQQTDLCIWSKFLTINMFILSSRWNSQNSARWRSCIQDTTCTAVATETKTSLTWSAETHMVYVLTIQPHCACHGYSINSEVVIL